VTGPTVNLVPSQYRNVSVADVPTALDEESLRRYLLGRPVYRRTRYLVARHGEAGARWLSQWFGEAVTEPVRLHVAAKRYLCATEPGYLGLLSAESVRTLALQGGPMRPDERAAFEALPHARDAVAVRRWDDGAKDPAVTPPGFAHFTPLLAALVRA